MFKERYFFFFKQGKDKNPVLLLGVKGGIRSEKDELVKEIGKAPDAQGKVKAQGKKLFFQVEKGNVSALQKGIQTIGKKVSALKGAKVGKDLPEEGDAQNAKALKGSVKEKLKAKLGGASKKFTQRADKIESKRRLAKLQQHVLQNQTTTERPTGSG